MQVAVCCIITSTISRIHERKQRYEAHLVAAGLKSMRQSMDYGSRMSTVGLESEMSMDMAFDGRPSAPRASGLFFGATGSPDMSVSGTYGAGPSGRSAVPVAESGSGAATLPPIAEGSDRRPETPNAGLGPGPVAEGALWTTWAGRDRSAPQPPPAAVEDDLEAPAGASAGAESSPSPFTSGFPRATKPKKQGYLQRGRMSLSKFVTTVNTTSRNVHSRISADEAYAQVGERKEKGEREAREVQATERVVTCQAGSVMLPPQPSIHHGFACTFCHAGQPPAASICA